MFQEPLPHTTRKPLPSTGVTSEGISVRRTVETWAADGAAQGFSPRTQGDREDIFRRFFWWLEHEEKLPGGADADLSLLTSELLRRFFAYCRAPHSTGRFGSDRDSARHAAKPSTVHRYYRELRAFLNFCVAEECLRESPLRNVKAPRLTSDQVQPLSPTQVEALLHAVAHTDTPDRNRAILLALLDTGLRVSELCALRVGDLAADEIRVVGKGGKARTVYLGCAARRALNRYVRKARRGADDSDPLFVGEGGRLRGSALGASGIRQMLGEAARLAGVQGVRVSPHTLRHTFAIQFLRGGGNLFELQRLMGHTDLTILRRYVALAESDLAAAHRRASPIDRMIAK